MNNETYRYGLDDTETTERCRAEAEVAGAPHIHSMKTFRHVQWTGKRDYECTQVVACRATEAPNANWIPCEESDLPLGMTKLQIIWGVEYWGYL